MALPTLDILVTLAEQIRERLAPHNRVEVVQEEDGNVLVRHTTQEDVPYEAFVHFSDEIADAFSDRNMDLFESGLIEKDNEGWWGEWLRFGPNE